MTTHSQLIRTESKGIDRPIVLFFVLAFAIAWGAFGVVALIALQSGLETLALMEMGETLQFEGTAVVVPEWSVYLLTRIADFSFSIAGVIMIGATAGTAGLLQLWRRLTHWRISWKWYLAGLLPLIFYGAATALAGVGDSADFSGGAILTALFSIQSGFFVSLFLRGALGEELGLRGFALPRLQERMTPFKASAVIGFFWAVWHLPVLLGRDVLSAVFFLLLAFGLGFVFTWLFNGSKGSLIPVLLFHATQNWEDGFETIFPGLLGTDWELISTLALLALGVVAAVAVWRNGRGERVLID
jgi:membrane protease YdiL (CAAX protease family)